MLRVGSLFSGIGGFDLGLERTGGFRTVWFCEQDEFCRSILGRHWPGVPCYPDVTHLRGADVKPVDVLCGGFPCQDLSLAGTGAGLDGARSGLWGEYARLVGELRPRYVIVENTRDGLWTTPCADDTGHRTGKYAQGGTALSAQAGGPLNPTWIEWLMGFPLGWTEPPPSATRSSRRSRRGSGSASSTTNTEPSAMPPEPGYNDRELERGRRIRDEAREGDYCPDCHYTTGHAAGCPASPALEEGERR